MTTSRTGTGKYRQWRKRVLHKAQAEGITHCPHCHVLLDYKRGRLPNSAEPDHILPHRWGGKETLDNGRVLCRRCNQSRGAGAVPRTKPMRATTVDFDW